jgi:glycosyltransferase involved in cell wall biosynthesis
MRFSIIVPNFNYGRFLADAIDSALALDHPDVEVIVVDDGSTDESRSVMERYGDRIIPIHQANAGNASACSAGFLRATGDVVMFLDADDILEPSVAKEVAAVWTPRVSKVQFQLALIDATGVSSGRVFPQFLVVPTPDDVRGFAATVGSYPSPPGSGNAYARWFLEKICPFEPGDRACDSYAITAAPFLGDVVTIPKPLARYRVHGANLGAINHVKQQHFSVDVARALWRSGYARRIAARAGVTIDPRALEHNLHVACYRVASFRLSRDKHPIDGDSRLRILKDAWRGVQTPQGLSTAQCAALLGWIAAMTAAPTSACATLAGWRFAAAERPQFLRKALQSLRVLTSQARA